MADARPTAAARGPTSKGWYLVGAGLVASALAIALTGFYQMTDSVRGLQRLAMPGQGQVTLAPGRTTLYYEHRSTLRGTAYSAPAQMSITCRVTDAQERPQELAVSASSVQYAFGDFAGKSAFDLQLAGSGTYTVRCEAEQPFVLAIGGGVGAWIVVAVVGGLVPGLGGVLVCVLVWVRRRRHRSTRAKQGQPS